MIGKFILSTKFAVFFLGILFGVMLWKSCDGDFYKYRLLGGQEDFSRVLKVSSTNY